MCQRKKLGLCLLVAANLFAWLETAYFGSHWLPDNPNELICDTTAFIASVVGCLMALYDPTTR